MDRKAQKKGKDTILPRVITKSNLPGCSKRGESKAQGNLKADAYLLIREDLRFLRQRRYRAFVSSLGRTRSFPFWCGARSIRVRRDEADRIAYWMRSACRVISFSDVCLAYSVVVVFHAFLVFFLLALVPAAHRAVVADHEVVWFTWCTDNWSVCLAMLSVCQCPGKGHWRSDGV